MFYQFEHIFHSCENVARDWPFQKMLTLMVTIRTCMMFPCDQAPIDVMGVTFDGCIGDVEMDGKPIGLFNFRHLVESQNCRGCVAVYVTVSISAFTNIKHSASSYIFIMNS